MTLLVGDDGTGWTNSDGLIQSSSGNDLIKDYTGAATGTASTAYVYIADWQSATACSLALYNSSNELIAESGTISSGGGTGLRSASISASITASASYYLVLMLNGYTQLRRQSGSAYFGTQKGVGDPGSAPATLDHTGEVQTGSDCACIMYLDGTTGGGTTEITAGVGAVTAAGQAPTRLVNYARDPGAGEVTAAGHDPALIERSTRYAYPSADLDAGPWTPSTGTALYAMIDESVADDGDYIVTNTAGVAKITLMPVSDPAASSGHVVNYRIWSPVGGNAMVRLVQGASTVIASWDHTGLPTSPTNFSQGLSGAEADSITNYDDLHIEFEAT